MAVGRMGRRLGAMAAAGLLLGTVLAGAAGAQKGDDPALPDEINALHQQAAQLFQARKYTEAMPIALQALALAEQRFDPDDGRLARLLYRVAQIHDHQGRRAEAEPIYRRTLAVLEKTRGAEHVSVGWVLNNLGAVHIRFC